MLNVFFIDIHQIYSPNANIQVYKLITGHSQIQNITLIQYNTLAGNTWRTSSKVFLNVAVIQILMESPLPSGQNPCWDILESHH